MKGQRGSFLGFTYNNIHSSVLGITRTSEGDRFDLGLAPTLKDFVTEVPNENGQYFFGAKYSKRDFTIKYAFDGITEYQLQIIKSCWGDKKIHDLIFDETPYKIYSAQMTGNSQIKHLAFEENGQRIYKGEGSFIFTCYFPLARSRYEYQQDYVVENINEWVDDSNFYILQENAIVVKEGLLNRSIIQYDLIDDETETVTSLMHGEQDAYEEWLYDDNLLIDAAGSLDETCVPSQYGLIDSELNNYDEWIESSKIPDNLVYGKFSQGKYHLFNAGDISVPFKIWFVLPDTEQLSFTISCGNKSISFEGITKQKLPGAPADYYCVFDSGSNSLEGYSSERKQTGTLYNHFLKEGAFFLLPIGEQDLYITGAMPNSIDLKYYYL